ncbi:MAG: hypothetical protein ACI4NG_00165 [Candidatus Gallimonas sp.]
MKKKSFLLTCIVLMAMMIAVLCGCSSYGGIKSSYEKAGFTESESLESVQNEIMKALNTDNEEEIAQICKVHAFTKNVVHIAVIFEFQSTEKMNEIIQESETLKGAIKDAQNSEYVNGNCVLFPICTSEAKAPFKG